MRNKITKANKNLRYFLWTLVGLVLLGGAVFASTYTINSQGVFVDGNKSYARTADVVVCRGTSLADDIIKSFQCDVVCKSTDGDCSNIIDDFIISNKKVYLKGGIYPWNNDKTFDSLDNVYIIGDLNTKIIFSNSKIAFTNCDNMNIENINLNGSTSGDAGYIRFTNGDNIFLNNIRADSYNPITRVMYLSNLSNVKLSNLYFNGTSSTCQIDGSGTNWIVEGNYFNNFGGGCNIAFGSLCHSKIRNNFFNSNNSAYAGISLEEFSPWCQDSLAYYDIDISDNSFNNINGIQTKNRNVGYGLKDIRVFGNMILGLGTPIIFEDKVDSLMISNNIIQMLGEYHAITIMPDNQSDDLPMSNIMINGNNIWLNSVSEYGAITIQNTSEVMISGNKINSTKDGININGGVNTVSILNNHIYAHDKTIRGVSGVNIYESNNDLYVGAGGNLYSLASLTQPFYLERYLYSQTSVLTCSNAGFFAGKTINLLNNTGAYICTCINASIGWGCNNIALL